MHSYARLALGVITSPQLALQQVYERKLLVQAIWIVAITGAIAALKVVVNAHEFSALNWFLIGKNNPITQLGLYFLYAAVLTRILTWLQSDAELEGVLTIMGWSQVFLALFHVVAIVQQLLMAYGMEAQIVLTTLQIFQMAFYVWYIFVIAYGLQTVYKIPTFRAVISYSVVATAGMLAFQLALAQARSDPFRDAPEMLLQKANQLAQADGTGWLLGALLGFIFGIKYLAKSREWSQANTIRFMTIGIATGAVMLGGYLWATFYFDYYGKLANVNYFYKQERFARAAEELLKVPEAPKLFVGELYYLAGESKKALAQYDELEESIDEIRGSKQDQDKSIATLHVHRGTVYLSDEIYDKALGEFEKAKKLWESFREPYVRSAVTYAIMDEHDKSLEEADYALQELGSEAALAWTALAEASAVKLEENDTNFFTRNMYTNQLKTAIAMVSDTDADLAERIGEKRDSWRSACDKIERKDLKYPLKGEEAVAPDPRQTAPKTEEESTEVSEETAAENGEEPGTEEVDNTENGDKEE